MTSFESNSQMHLNNNISTSISSANFNLLCPHGQLWYVVNGVIQDPNISDSYNQSPSLHLPGDAQDSFEPIQYFYTPFSLSFLQKTMVPATNDKLAA
jgi:hypothetical protein